jgi:hypothetical protein
MGSEKECIWLHDFRLMFLKRMTAAECWGRVTVVQKSGEAFRGRNTGDLGLESLMRAGKSYHAISWHHANHIGLRAPSNPEISTATDTLSDRLCAAARYPLPLPADPSLALNTAACYRESGAVALVYSRLRPSPFGPATLISLFPARTVVRLVHSCACDS